MSSLYAGNNIYPDVKVNVATFRTERYYVVPAEFAHNPVRVAAAALDNPEDADLLWLANHIHNPFKELVAGKLLAIPMTIAMKDAQTLTVQDVKTTRIKQAKVNGAKIVY